MPSGTLQTSAGHNLLNKFHKREKNEFSSEMDAIT
jgi:hypothetical protein